MPAGVVVRRGDDDGGRVVAAMAVVAHPVPRPRRVAALPAALARRAQPAHHLVQLEKKNQMNDYIIKSSTFM